MSKANATHPIVLGTAGHIDHGKTALVKALTGIDTDRLKEEKERGITTELGFAHLELGGRRFGLVDVPGHERFIKAMVSGAGGLDLVCLVIAADEGIMPQTREHLDICELLGVRRGVVALTKTDLVDDDWVELVSEEIREELSRSFLRDARIVGVSAKTGDGLDDLRTELLRITDELPSRSPDGLFRLPLDRVFTIKGFGTVVTGTVLGGRVTIGDSVITHPRGVTAKVRGVEVHGEPADEAVAGTRCALNLAGVGIDDVGRGDLLAHVDALAPSHLIDARFRYLSTSRAPLGRRSRVLLHHGTTQMLATLVLVEGETLDPGGEALVQLHLDIGTPLAALPGDRFIARGFTVQKHYGTTLGGGEILRVKAPKVRRSSKEAEAAVLTAMAEAAGDERLELEVKTHRVAGLSASDLVKRLGMTAAEVSAASGRLVASGGLVSGGDTNPSFLHAEVFARLEKTMADVIDADHEKNPERSGVGRQELRGRLPAALPQPMFDELLATLIRRDRVILEDDRVRPGTAARFGTEPMSPIETTLDSAFRGWGHMPPKIKDIASALSLDAKATPIALAKLLAAGRVIKVKSDLYAHAEAIDALRDQLLAYLESHGQITAPEWKALTGATRKWSIPLAEYFDQAKVTLRIGDIRKRRG